jgi:hypothetical protein
LATVLVSLLLHVGSLGVHRGDSGLGARVNVLDVLGVFSGQVIELVGLVDQRGGLLLHIILAGAADGCRHAHCQANH